MTGAELVAAMDRELLRREKAVPGDPEELPLLTRLSARMEPAARRAFLAAVHGAAGVVDLEGLAHAIQNGNVTLIEARAEIDKLGADLRRQVLPVLGRLFSLGVHVGAEAVPNGPGVFDYGFDLRNPEAITWVREHAAELVRNVTDSTRAGIRSLIEVAFREGRHPLQTAREIREVIGLSERQTTAVQNFRARLTDAGRPADEVERRAARYAGAQLRARAETIARSETLMASGRGQQALWDAAAAQGFLDADRTQRQWLATNDDLIDQEVCFPACTPILTLDGWKPISRVAIGEFVLTHADRFRRVVGISRRHHNGMTVRMDLRGRYGIAATATFGHRILTRRGWIKAEALTLDDAVALYALPCDECGAPVPHGPAGHIRLCGPCAQERPARANTKRWSRPEAHREASAANRRRWSDPGARAVQAQKLRGRVVSAETRRKISASRAVKPLQERPRRRTRAEWNASAEHPFRSARSGAGNRKAAEKLVAWRAGLSAQHRQQIEERAAHNGHVALGRTHRASSLERRVASFLTSQRIEYVAQWPYRYGTDGRMGIADFYLPGARVVVECDGYYHTLPEVAARDALKSTALQASGIRVLRFSETAIKQHFQDVASAIRQYCCIAWRPLRALTHRPVRHQPVYDLVVEDDHSFVAGGIVVHNCEPMADKLAQLDEPWVLPDGREVMVPTESHPRCFVPDTRVAALAVAGLKAAYSGPVITLETRSGHRLTVTPNHPILTRRGWLPAQRLRKGDYVLSERWRFRGLARWAPEDQHGPAVIEQVVDALRPRGLRRVQIAREDLHGDAFWTEGQVEIVGADRILRRGPKSPPPQLDTHRVLVATDMAQTLSAILRCGDQSRQRYRLTARRSPRSSQLTLDRHSIGLQRGPLQALGLGPSARSDAASQKARPNHASAHSKRVGNRLFGLSIAVAGADLGHVEVSAPRTAVSLHRADNVPFVKTAPYDGGAGAKLARDLLVGEAARIQVDQLVSINRHSWHGHVYDLQTRDGFILAEGIVASNCRCSAGLVIGEPE